MKKTFILAVLDGWGIGDIADDNAIAVANTPNYDDFLEKYSHTTLQASAADVGLPDGQVGNSEVGHLTIGAGRVIPQALVRMNALFEDAGEHLLQQKPLQEVISKVKESGSRVHLLGLLSEGRIHGSQAHIETMYDVLRSEGVDVCVHAILDGRDAPPTSAVQYVKDFLAEGQREISTLSGRYCAMDRDNNWDRVKLAYDAIVRGEGDRSFVSAAEYIKESYAKNVTDEFVIPAASNEYKGVEEGDVLVCLNFRSDRVRQILAACLDPDFNAFSRGESWGYSQGVGMVSYSDHLNTLMETLLPDVELKNTLGEWVSQQGMRQLRVAETEKYAHVTFFLNGGREQTFEGEKRRLVPSPNVTTYDLRPEMRAEEVTQAVVNGIGVYDVIVVNYANADMVGHTGNLDAAIKAVEAIDQQLGVLESAVLNHGGGMLLTSDHGNIECMWNNTNDHKHTSHTLNSVPLIYISERGNAVQFESGGSLSNVAATLLTLMGLEVPLEMEGKCLII